MLPRDSRSVTLNYSRALASALNSMGKPLPFDARNILADIDQQERVPMERQEQLWQCLADSHSDPLLGIRLGQAIQASQLGLVGYLLMTQENLGEAVDQLLQYHPLVGEGGQFELRRGAQHVDLCYLPNYVCCAQLRVETVLAACLTQIREMTGGQLRAHSLQLAYPAPSLAIQHQYQAALQTPVHFGAPVSAIRLRPEDLRTRLVAADHQVMNRLKPEADALLKSLNNKSLHLRVAHLLQQEPQLTREQVASRLCMSPRHLGRKLTAEDASFRAIQDEVRSHYARRWLTEGKRNNSEIAAALGYCDESAFGKAFRRWTGASPKAWRMTGQREQEPA
ncbi:MULTISPECIES: AraC family transcriptional regulator [Microbulbifer]|uniref:AraC family transcriptional regulator n=1 Tax=Microbulbifer TaxID=48073 RepID=UPI001E625394|nr:MULTISPECIES: AraC family transcriptional regulator [Microbulbifer]UHQ55981.1 AraC family transcriptional regulator [Microbulbifer sp. YPW16]